MKAVISASFLTRKVAEFVQFACPAPYAREGIVPSDLGRPRDLGVRYIWIIFLKNAEYTSEWELWKRTHGKMYPTDAEELCRRTI